MRAMAMASPTSEINSRAIVRGILEAKTDDKIILSLPNTEYRLHLVPSVPPAAITTPIGKRLKGTIHARSLRMFKAAGGGGGQFIEPLEGAPRIVAGRVAHVDAASHRVLVEVPAALWMTLAEGQKADMFAVGDMVNCYVESGTRFEPA